MHIHRNGGRIGCRDRTLREFFNDDATAEVALEASLERKRKRKRGYNGPSLTLLERCANSTAPERNGSL